VVGEAETGAQGVALAQDLRPDIVIMDVEMPVMDGIQTAQYLHDLAPDCVIVLLTTKDTFETHGRAMAAGARVIVEKGNLPIFRASLHGLVRFVRARNAPAWPDIGAPSAPLEESQA
jgi:DNA-binding NarL/FixJ family response regulator